MINPHIDKLSSFFYGLFLLLAGATVVLYFAFYRSIIDPSIIHVSIGCLLSTNFANLHYYLDLLSISLASELALFATGLTRREISSPCLLELLSILSIGLDEFSSIAAKFPQSCCCSNRLHLNIFLLVVSIILHKFSRLIIPLSIPLET
jgi:hypothetical protein